MTNKEIGKVLKNTADMIELTGGNPFRARSMANAGRMLERLEESVEKLAGEGKLTSLRGIGEGLASQISELVETGTFEAREDLIGAIPAGVMEIIRIKGLGAKKVRALWQNMGITTLEELERSASAGLIATQDGFGAKTQENILKNIQLLKQYMTRRRYADVISFAKPILESLRETEGIGVAEPTGELRRKVETVGCVELIVQAESVESVEKILRPWIDPENEKTDTSTDAALKGRLVNGLPFRIYLSPPESFGTMLWQLTGSDTHIEQFINRFGEPERHAREESVYTSAGIAPVPPEIREGSDEIERAEKDDLPALIRVEDLKGTLHNHSTYSDGAHSLETMADTARAMGLSYFGICDHSQSLVVANGLSPDEVARQQEEIQALNERFASDGGSPFKIFSGIESDILGDGSLDYSEEVLATFDLVVASVHTRMNMNADDATERIIKAVMNPYTTILGHPTGRILLVREGYPIHYERVLDACAEQQVAIELNANPYRLDLDWRWIRAATERGILISINPDAHSKDGLKDSYWGIEAARKGWLTADQCLNAMSLDNFEAWLHHRRARLAAG